MRFDETRMNKKKSELMAHHSTILTQLLKLVPRHEFEALAKRFHKGTQSAQHDPLGAVRGAGFGAALSGRCGLRDVVANLSAQPKRLYHLGVGRVARSSLARVNAEQPHELYEALFGRLLSRCRGKAPGHGFRFKHKALSLDSTTADLCLSMFPWARFRRTKGAAKLHTCLDHDGFLPAFMRVTDGRASDIEAARALRLPAGSIVAADRAYVDFAWINHSISKGVFLVTRMKKGIRHKVLERRPVKPANRRRGATSDQTIALTSAHGKKRCPHPLRRTGFRDPESGRCRVF